MRLNLIFVSQNVLICLPPASPPLPPPSTTSSFSSSSIILMVLSSERLVQLISPPMDSLLWPHHELLLGAVWLSGEADAQRLQMLTRFHIFLTWRNKMLWPLTMLSARLKTCPTVHPIDCGDFSSSMTRRWTFLVLIKCLYNCQNGLPWDLKK